MVKNIINQGITDYGEDITTTNNPTTMTEMLGRYPGMDRIQELQNLDFQNNPRDMATGTASDFRHAAAMNELSKSLSPMNNKVGNFIGDSLAYGLGAINEIPDAFRGFSFREGFDPQAMAAAKEDFAANYAGSFGTPNTATIEDVFAKTLGYQAPGTNVVRQTTSGPFNYGTAQAADLPTNSLERDFPGMSGSDIIEMMNNRGPVATNIEDAPQIKEAIYQDRIMNPNLPGFAFQPKESLRNIIGSQLQNAKTKAGQGFDLAKQIPGMILSAATGIPFAGQIAQGIGGLLGSVFQESPEQKNFRENIATDPEYQNLVNSIPGMSNYNQIFGMGSGRGLLGATNRRLATINKALGKMSPQQLAKTSLKKRKAKLEALRELERQKESAFLESQRRGRRPGTGGDGGGTRDSGGPTGGYSYDSGGRQGFGYGLKDGGLASMFTRRG